jgi:hypothetical protein
MVRVISKIVMVGLLGALMTGCAFRMTVTPITQEEIVQKSVTNQMYDWLFSSDKKGD